MVSANFRVGPRQHRDHEQRLGEIDPVMEEEALDKKAFKDMSAGSVVEATAGATEWEPPSEAQA